MQGLRLVFWQECRVCEVIGSGYSQKHCDSPGLNRMI